MKRWLKASIAGLFVALVGAGFAFTSLGTAFELAVGFPWLFHVRGPVAPPDNVVVVAIDGRTGEQLGLADKPRDWPRSIHGRLVDELVARGASAIAFDMFFGREKSAEDDQVFVDAVKRSGRVVLVELLTGKRQPISDAQGRHVGMVWAEEKLQPFPRLIDAATALATFPLPKEGASVYQYWAFKESTDNAPTLPAVALQLYARDAIGPVLDLLRAVAPEAFAQLPPLDNAFGDARQLTNFMRALRSAFDSGPASLKGFPATSPREPRILLEQALEAMYAGEANRFLNFYGPPGTISNVPYHAVIRGGDPNVSDEALDFTDKVVFVGYSDLFDPGQPDRFYTVFTRDDGVDLSGVEIAATGFANLLTNRALAPLGESQVIAMLLLYGLAMGLIVYGLPAYLGVPIAIALSAIYATAAQLAFNDAAMLAPVATPLLVQAPLALFIGLLGQYLLERRRGQRISDAINYYLPDDIARDLAQDRFDEAKLNKVVFSTCLATDMAGFSTIAEQMPPGELAAYMNDYFETLAAPLKKHGVHVTEFRADAIMCAWTAEQPSPDPRRKALLAALDAGEAIEDFRVRHELSEVSLRIGLEAGWVYVGHAGGGGRFVYSIVGDSANTASRVEGLNKQVGTRILATGEVVEGFDDLLTRYLGAFQFVGKTEAMPIYEVLAPRDKASAEQLVLCERFAAAIQDYEAGDWPAAAARLEQILTEFPDDGPTKFLLQHCSKILSSPDEHPEPGVIRMDTK